MERAVSLPCSYQPETRTFISLNDPLLLVVVEVVVVVVVSQLYPVLPYIVFVPDFMNKALMHYYFLLCVLQT